MTTDTRAPAATYEEQRDAFVGRLFEGAIATLDQLAVYLGDRLGLYAALAEHGPATAGELASRTGTHERYVREWLEHQAVGGFLEVDDAAKDERARRYTLPAPHAEALLQRDSLNYIAPLARAVLAGVRPAEALLAAFRNGGGIDWGAYGSDMIEAQGDFNRATFLTLLGSEWLPAIPDIHARLQSDPPARVADIGCGVAWSSIAIARAYPKAQVEGFDIDDSSIAIAARNIREAGLQGRVSAHVRDVADPALVGRYNLVTAFEMVHDMARPVDALRVARGLLAPGGSVLIMDERTADVFSAPGDETERLFYGFSIAACLPSGMAEQPSAGTGTVMRASTLERYAREAGFAGFEVLTIEHPMFRFYRLTP